MILVLQKLLLLILVIGLCFLIAFHITYHKRYENFENLKQLFAWSGFIEFITVIYIIYHLVTM